MKKILALIAVSTLVFMLTACGGPKYALKSSRTKGAMGKTVNLPYAKTVKYFGYVSPSMKADGKYKGKDAYYLYLWVPAAVDEIGVSMYSPADVKPGGSDFKSKTYDDMIGAKPDAFFDTYLALDRLLVLDAAKIKDGASAKVFPLATNDDTGEIHANPAGRKYNSLIRVQTDTGNISKALVRSVYRITFTSFRGNVEGSFLVQVGCNVPGVKIAPSLEELDALVNAE